MYSEITKELFHAVLDIEAKGYNIENKEFYYSYCVASRYGNHLKVVNNYCSAVIQYYIIDLNN